MLFCNEALMHALAQHWEAFKPQVSVGRQTKAVVLALMTLAAIMVG